MTIIGLSLLIASMFGCGIRFLVRQSMLHVVVGTVLLSNAAILFLIAAGQGGRVIPLLHSTEGASKFDFADPLVQAFALTAVVIGFATTVLLIRVTLSVQDIQRDLDVGALEEAEIEREEELK